MNGMKESRLDRIERNFGTVHSGCEENQGNLRRMAAWRFGACADEVAEDLFYRNIKYLFIDRKPPFRAIRKGYGGG